MLSIALAIFCLLGVGLFDLEENQNPVIHIEHGSLRGRRIESAAGCSFISFQGIPYAKPPLGPLRFKDAQPMDSWESVRNALTEGNPCTQYDWEEFEYLGKEDCLYINVYVPGTHSADADPALPVMVWIHGGGFVYGSSDIKVYGPDYLVSEEIILVTFNYRLGPFGFLYLDEAAPGNVGLKDQVAALHWVQRNIAAFGGNPEKVTIFGQSAGGASVHYQMLSPLSKGLFRGAIAQSGLAINPWARRRPEQVAEATRRLATAVGCDSTRDSHSVVECLRTIDHMVLMRAARTHAPSQEERHRFLNFLFVPTVDLDVADVERFLPDPAIEMVSKGHHPVPFITGLTNQESLLLIASNTDNFKEDSLKSVDSNWEKHVLPELRVKDESSIRASALNTVRKFFMTNMPLSSSTLQRYLDMFSDINTGESIAYTTKKYAITASAPIYIYNFIADDKLNLMKVESNISWPGATHGDDIGYLFHTVYLPTVFRDSSADLIRRRMVRLWTNFAKFGIPTPSNDELLKVHWEPFTNTQHKFLEIGSNLLLSSDLNADRFAFWEKFYKTYGSNNYDE